MPAHMIGGLIWRLLSDTINREIKGHGALQTQEIQKRRKNTWVVEWPRHQSSSPSRGSEHGAGLSQT